MVLGECYRSSHRFVKTTTKYKEKPTGIKIGLPNNIVLNYNVILFHICQLSWIIIRSLLDTALISCPLVCVNKSYR